MAQVSQVVTGQVYSVLLAPVTAHVVVRVGETFFETFLPRSEAEKLRVGRGDRIPFRARDNHTPRLRSAHEPKSRRFPT